MATAELWLDGAEAELVCEAPFPPPLGAGQAWHGMANCSWGCTAEKFPLIHVCD